MRSAGAPEWPGLLYANVSAGHPTHPCRLPLDSARASLHCSHRTLPNPQCGAPSSVREIGSADARAEGAAPADPRPHVLQHAPHIDGHAEGRPRDGTRRGRFSRGRRAPWKFKSGPAAPLIWPECTECAVDSYCQSEYSRYNTM